MFIKRDPLVSINAKLYKTVNELLSGSSATTLVWLPPFNGYTKVSGMSSDNSGLEINLNDLAEINENLASIVLDLIESSLPDRANKIANAWRFFSETLYCYLGDNRYNYYVNGILDVHTIRKYSKDMTIRTHCYSFSNREKPIGYVNYEEGEVSLSFSELDEMFPGFSERAILAKDLGLEGAEIAGYAKSYVEFDNLKETILPLLDIHSRP